MVQTGIAHLPLHPGKAPRWLFQKMVTLSQGILEMLIYEYGIDEVLRRLSDPFWFQAFSCVLGFDWHSSGTTTVTCGALKEALNKENLGLGVAGGKGTASRNTLNDIERLAERYALSSQTLQQIQYASRMSAKVDSSAVQDGYELYHHVIIFSETGRWAVIQQGLNNDHAYARRYHWLSENVTKFICEPHTAIVGDQTQLGVLDMTASQSISTQKISVDLVNDHPSHLKHDWAELLRPAHQRTLDDWTSPEHNKTSIEYLHMPRNINWQLMQEIYDVHPHNYEELIALPGVGPATVRALALIADLIYGEPPSWKDPIRYTFAHGGKDGVPFPVDQPTYQQSIDMIHEAVRQARISEHQKRDALKRFHRFAAEIPLCPVSS
ncbi:MAG: DUF763 domain-containing protein [Candidatus Thermoplasmatota archaeon]